MKSIIKIAQKQFDQVDAKITGWMKKAGLPLLRYSLAVIFIWFGILKPLGVSPAQELVAHTVYWFSPAWFVPFLGWWEVVIGLCLLYKPLIRLGILLPFLILPEVVFGAKPYALTTEGQYIVKNLILISAAIVIGSHVRDSKKQDRKK